MRSVRLVRAAGPGEIGEPVYIEGPEIRTRGTEVEYSVRYSLGIGDERTLWFRTSAEHAAMVSPRLDAAVVALLIPAMTAGGDLVLEGPVTDELVFRLHHGYQDILCALISSLRPVRLIARDATPPEARASGVAAGFSGGVDSFLVLADHFYDPAVPASFKISHLLFNNVGSHEEGGGKARELYRDRLDHASLFVKQLGLPLVPVDSNLTEAFDPLRFDFQQTNSPRNAAVAFLLQRGIGRWLYASTYPFRSIHVGSSYDTAYSDPVALPLLSTSSLQLETHGGQYGRFDKTMRIAQIPGTYDFLDVCVAGGVGVNCSACFKCLRTLAALEIGGILDRYEAVFDMDVYQRHRDQYLASARLSRDLLVRELLVEAKRRGFTLPSPSLRRISPPIYRHIKWEGARYGARLREAMGGRGRGSPG